MRGTLILKLCPRCDKEMVKRNGKYGEFWGCTGYPYCDCTEQIGTKENKSTQLEREATAFLARHGIGRNGR